MNHESSHSAPRNSLADRDKKIEELLLTGLEHYFEGRYERAVTVWTRVLFLDRGHARARSYIERARGALAERQRESEELLHNGLSALDRGEIGAARELLRSAIERGGPRDDAVAVLERVARLEAAAGPTETATRLQEEVRQPTGRGEPRSRGWARRLSVVLVVLTLGALVLGGYYVWNSWSELQLRLLPTSPVPEAPLPIVREDPLPQPTIGELALARGRALFERGRLHDALVLLEEIGPADPLRGQADELQATIQELLLSAVSTGNAEASGGAQ